MVIDAIARHGVRKAIKSLLSPQNTTSDRTEKSTPRYVCARKIYESGRKGRACIYRISDERTGRGGRRVRLYTNVASLNLDEDERQSFTSIEHTRNYNMGCSMRQTKGRTPPTLDEVVKSKVESKRLDVKPCGLSDDGSDRRSKSDNTAPSQAKHLSLSSSLDKESVVPQPVNSRKQPRRKSRSDPHRGVSVVERRQSPARPLSRRKASHFCGQTSLERPMQDELGSYCSGALPVPWYQPDRLNLESALTKLSRKLRATATNGTIKLVDDAENDASGVREHDQVGGERNASAMSEAPGSPFMQPGLTRQESSDLVFGTGSKMATRRKLRAGRVDAHEFAFHLVRDDTLGEAEPKNEACSPSQKLDAFGSRTCHER